MLLLTEPLHCLFVVWTFDDTVRYLDTLSFRGPGLKAAIARSVSRLTTFSLRSCRLSMVDFPRPTPISTFTWPFFQ